MPKLGTIGSVYVLAYGLSKTQKVSLKCESDLSVGWIYLHYLKNLGANTPKLGTTV